MIKKIGERLLNFSAFISLAFGVFSVLFISLIVVMLFTSQQNFNLSKLFVVIIILIIIAIALFFFFFGIYEFLKHLISVEKKVDLLEDEVIVLERDEVNKW